MKTIWHIFLRAWAILIVATKRTLAQRGLAVATLLGLIVTIALVLSIPLYSEAVYYRVLRSGLFSDAPTYRGIISRPPVSLLYKYSGSFTGPVQWQNVQPLDTYFSDGIYHDLKLHPSPETPGVRLFNTGLFGFFQEKDAAVVTEKTPEFQVGLATLRNPNEHITVLDGHLPHITADTTAPIEIMVSRSVAEKMGLQIGEMTIAYDLRALHRYEADPAKLMMQIVGVWEPANANAEFWEQSQFPADKLLIVDEQTFIERISPKLSDEIYQALWYMPMNAEEIFVSDVAPLLSRFITLDKHVAKLLPGTALYISPVKVLENYQKSAAVLNVLLFTFSIPIISLVVTFVSLVVSLTMESQRNQVAALRSRGATVPQVVGLSAVESGLLGLVALLVGIPISLLVAYTIGQTRSFLDFSLATDLRIGMTWATARYGVLALIVTVIAQVLPSLDSARHTIVTYKMEAARRMRPSWWQRVGLDFWLLIPAGYGMYILNQRGTLFQTTENGVESVLNDPLLFLVPALSLVVLALLVLRVLPLLMRLFSWFGQFTRSVGFLLAARQLSRAPGLYAAPLALLILTLGLSTYSASLAATLDRHLFDQQGYRTGADISLVDTGEQLGGGTGAMGGAPEGTILQWQFIPANEYVKIAGIEAATRVGVYKGLVQTSEGFDTGTFIGVDRTEFGGIAFWRSDFAAKPLGELMNDLALTYNGVLLPSAFMDQYYLNIGDSLNVAVISYGQNTTLRVVIVGEFDYFPTWYPETGPLIVGNLDYFFQEAQGQFPYRVWFNVASDADFIQISNDVWEMNLGAEGVLSASQRILTEQQKPERQGLLGLLSVGFSAAAVLTALGFLIYAIFSFRRRSIELGVLRAAGLSSRHLASYVAWELAFLLIIGSAAGTGLGIWASQTFVPYMQLETGMMASVPPFAVEIAWADLLRIYTLFVILFIIVLALLVRLMLKMKLFQVIKMGETV